MTACTRCLQRLRLLQSRSLCVSRTAVDVFVQWDTNARYSRVVTAVPSPYTVCRLHSVSVCTLRRLPHGSTAATLINDESGAWAAVVGWVSRCVHLEQRSRLSARCESSVEEAGELGGLVGGECGQPTRGRSTASSELTGRPLTLHWQSEGDSECSLRSAPAAHTHHRLPQTQPLTATVSAYAAAVTRSKHLCLSNSPPYQSTLW